MPENDDLLRTAVEAARAGAGVIKAAHRSGDRVSYKTKARNDFVTAVDREAETAIVETIRSRHPDHAIMAEESGETDPGGAYRWIIDPLDGTTNFIHGFPVFAISVAAARSGAGSLNSGDLEVGVIHDPLRGETFKASRGGGAFLQDEPVRISGIESIERSLLVTGFPFRAPDLLETYLRIFADLHMMSHGIRRAGSAALDLAYTACGRSEGFFEFCLSPWDMAAGALLVREAGGMVRDFTGGEDYLNSGHIVAGPPAIAGRILDVISRHYPGGGEVGA
jgi:myo-inositol-1(or 4)-monophosphatase